MSPWLFGRVCCFLGFFWGVVLWGSFLGSFGVPCGVPFGVFCWVFEVSGCLFQVFGVVVLGGWVGCCLVLEGLGFPVWSDFFLDVYVGLLCLFIRLVEGIEHAD